jgi:hypothetical protein
MLTCKGYKMSIKLCKNYSKINKLVKKLEVNIASQTQQPMSMAKK